MKKTFITLFSFLGILLIANCNSGTHNETKKNEVSAIDTKILLQNKFEQSNPAFEYTLIFKEDQSYQITYKGPLQAGLGVSGLLEYPDNGVFYVEGEYELKDSLILLHPKKYLDIPNGKTIDPSKAWGEASCTILDKEFTQNINDITVTYTKHLLVKIPNVPGDFQEVQLGISGFLKNQNN